MCLKIDDVVVYFSHFLNEKETWYASAVCKQWNACMTLRKKILVTLVVKDIETKHYCNNICPCILSETAYVKTFFPHNTLLLLYACYYLERPGDCPEWFQKCLQPHPS